METAVGAQEETKKCVKCGEEKPLVEFTVSMKHGKPWRNVRCVDCLRAAKREHWHKNYGCKHVWACGDKYVESVYPGFLARYGKSPEGCEWQVCTRCGRGVSVAIYKTTVAGKPVVPAQPIKLKLPWKKGAAPDKAGRVQIAQRVDSPVKVEVEKVVEQKDSGDEAAEKAKSIKDALTMELQAHLEAEQLRLEVARLTDTMSALSERHGQLMGEKQLYEESAQAYIKHLEIELADVRTRLRFAEMENANIKLQAENEQLRHKLVELRRKEFLADRPSNGSEPDTAEEIGIGLRRRDGLPLR